MSSNRKPPASRGSQEKQTATASIDYDHLIRLGLKYWHWILAGVLVGLIGGYYYASTQTYVYSARATILVPSKDNGITSLENTGETDVTSGDLIKTFEQLLQTKALVQRVVKTDHLNENPDFLPKGSTPPIPEEFAVGMLAGSVNIHVRPSTRLIDITVEHTSAKMAAILANRLAEEARTQEFNQPEGGATVLSDYLEKEVTRLTKKVSDSEQKLQDYQTEHHISGSIDHPDDVYGTRIKELNQQYIAALAQVTLLKERYEERHPKLMQAESLVDGLREQIAQAQNDADKTIGDSIGLNALKSVLEADRAQLNTMLKALHDSETAAHLAIPGVKIIEEATTPYAPIRPNKTKLISTGGFLGLLCGAGLVFALYFIDGTIRNVSQAEGAFNLPVVTAIPILKEGESSSILPTFSDPRSFVAEAFRGLRATLILHDRKNPLKTILVGSAVPGEGKSFCAANLSVAFAQAGFKTLLIDADLRLPTLHTYFNLAPNEPAVGLKEVLEGKAILSSSVMESLLPNLHLLLTSSPADFPGELLSGAHLHPLLDEATQKYDRIVIDSAPLNAVSDTMLILPRADAILLVVRAAQTLVSETKSALDKIYSSHMKPLGIILNYMEAHKLKSYTYGYSYGQKPTEKNAK